MATYSESRFLVNQEEVKDLQSCSKMPTGRHVDIWSSRTFQAGPQNTITNITNVTILPPLYLSPSPPPSPYPLYLSPLPSPSRTQRLPRHGGPLGKQQPAGAGLRRAADPAAVGPLLPPGPALRAQRRAPPQERHRAAGHVSGHVWPELAWVRTG